MYHKQIKLKLDGSKHYVRMHSIDGHTWLAGSPRQAQTQALSFAFRRKREYSDCKSVFARNVDDKD